MLPRRRRHRAPAGWVAAHLAAYRASLRPGGGGRTGGPELARGAAGLAGPPASSTGSAPSTTATPPAPSPPPTSLPGTNMSVRRGSCWTEVGGFSERLGRRGRSLLSSEEGSTCGGRLCNRARGDHVRAGGAGAAPRGGRRPRARRLWVLRRGWARAGATPAWRAPWTRPWTGRHGWWPCAGPRSRPAAREPGRLVHRRPRRRPSPRWSTRLARHAGHGVGGAVERRLALPARARGGAGPRPRRHEPQRLLPHRRPARPGGGWRRAGAGAARGGRGGGGRRQQGAGGSWGRCGPWPTGWCATSSARPSTGPGRGWWPSARATGSCRWTATRWPAPRSWPSCRRSPPPATWCTTPCPAGGCTPTRGRGWPSRPGGPTTRCAWCATTPRWRSGPGSTPGWRRCSPPATSRRRSTTSTPWLPRGRAAGQGRGLRGRRARAPGVRRRSAQRRPLPAGGLAVDPPPPGAGRRPGVDRRRPGRCRPGGAPRPGRPAGVPLVPAAEIDAAPPPATCRTMPTGSGSRCSTATTASPPASGGPCTCGSTTGARPRGRGAWTRNPRSGSRTTGAPRRRPRHLRGRAQPAAQPAAARGDRRGAGVGAPPPPTPGATCWSSTSCTSTSAGSRRRLPWRSAVADRLAPGRSEPVLITTDRRPQLPAPGPGAGPLVPRPPPRRPGRGAGAGRAGRGARRDDEPFEVVTPGDLPLEPARAAADGRPSTTSLELATALKPILLRHLLVDRGEPRPPTSTPTSRCSPRSTTSPGWRAAHGIVLTPHRLGAAARRRPPARREQVFAPGRRLQPRLRAGRAGAAPFLDWWAERCRRDCVALRADGLFVDQRWIDLARHVLPPPRAARPRLQRRLLEPRRAAARRRRRTAVRGRRLAAAVLPLQRLRHRRGPTCSAATRASDPGCCCPSSRRWPSCAAATPPGSTPRVGPSAGSCAYGFDATADGLRLDRGCGGCSARRCSARARTSRTVGPVDELPDPFDPADGRRASSPCCARRSRQRGAPHPPLPPRPVPRAGPTSRSRSPTSRRRPATTSCGGSADDGPRELGLPPELVPSEDDLTRPTHPPPPARPGACAGGVLRRRAGRGRGRPGDGGRARGRGRAGAGRQRARHREPPAHDPPRQRRRRARRATSTSCASTPTGCPASLDRLGGP